MTLTRWTEIDNYLESKLIPVDPALSAAIAASQAAGLPNIAVSPSQGKLLHLLAASIGARAILEIGTFGGYSAIWMARALAEGGRLISLERSPRIAEIAKANLAEAGLTDKVEIWIGQALELLPKVGAAGLGPFDFTFIDADKAIVPEYFDWAVKLSRPGAMIVVDNIVRGGRVTDSETVNDDVLGLRRLNDELATDKRVTATAMQTVGVKGHDGFILAMVNRE